MSTNAFDDLLTAADPVRRSAPASRDALAALREEILHMTSFPVDSLPTSRRRRRSRRALVAVAAAIAVVTIGGAAAASGFLARTGAFGSGGEEGYGELIRTDAPDAPTVIAELGADFPLPPGGTFGKAIAAVQANAGLATEDAVRSTLAWNAACQWATFWINGDAAQRSDAQRVLDDVPNWRALTDHNPDGGVRRIWQNVAVAARAGDVGALRAAGYDANCA